MEYPVIYVQDLKLGECIPLSLPDLRAIVGTFKICMNILITGGSGFIGSYLTQQLMTDGHRVAVIDNTTNYLNKDVYFKRVLKVRQQFFSKKPLFEFKSDIRNVSKISLAINKFKPDTIVHLAGISATKIPDTYSELIQPINLGGTLNVLNVFEKNKFPKKIVYASSSMVYGTFAKNPQPENAALNPTTMYGATKAAGEHFVKLSKKKWVIVRPTTVYGFTDCAGRVTQLLMEAAMMGKPAWIVDGEMLDFTYIDDLIDGLIRCITMDEANFQTFNLSGGKARSVHDFAKAVATHFPNFSYEVRKPSGPMNERGTLDISKAKKLLSFTPRTSMEQGVSQIVKHMNEYKWEDVLRT